MAMNRNALMRHWYSKTRTFSLAHVFAEIRVEHV
jgi:hypothetical protein